MHLGGSVRVLPLFLAAIANAQVGDVTVRLYDETDGSSSLLDDEDLRDYFGIANCDCGPPVRAEIDVGSLSGVSATTDVDIRGGANCDSDDKAVRNGCLDLGSFDYDLFAAGTQQTSFQLWELTDDCAAHEEDFGIYALVDETQDGTFEGVGVRSFPVDTSVPAVPLPDGEPSGGDGAVRVAWDPPDGEILGKTGGYQVFCARDGDPVFKSGTFERKYATALTECPDLFGAPSGLSDLDPAYLCSDLVTGQSARISPLQNGAAYDFYVVAVDDLRNPSGLVPLGSATPEATDDFYARYVQAGGPADGGFCSLSGGRPGLGAAIFALCVLVLLRRRALIVLVAMLAARPALAAEENRYASPQHFAAEVKFGPYLPDVDGQFPNGRTPYQDVFGNDSSLLTQFELDWQFLRTPIGSVGAGLLYGFFSESAAALAADGTRSEADETSLRAHTLGALLVLRADALWRYAHVPLVPYGKIGLDYYIWWVTEGDGSVANCPDDCPFSDDPQSVKARGGAWGWQVSPGLALLLDVLDPQAAKLLDTEIGINHTYLFVELLIADVDNFGSATNPTLHLGDRTWTAGLAFEF